MDITPHTILPLFIRTVVWRGIVAISEMIGCERGKMGLYFSERECMCLGLRVFPLICYNMSVPRDLQILASVVFSAAWSCIIHSWLHKVGGHTNYPLSTHGGLKGRFMPLRRRRVSVQRPTTSGPPIICQAWQTTHGWVNPVRQLNSGWITESVSHSHTGMTAPDLEFVFYFAMPSSRLSFRLYFSNGCRLFYFLSLQLIDWSQWGPAVTRDLP